MDIVRSMSSSPVTRKPPAATGVDIADDAGTAISRAQIDLELKAVIDDVLGIGAERAEALEPGSGLFGHMPELDSMAVAGLLTEIEDRFDIVIDDDDVDGETLELYGGLLAFVEAKLATA